MRYLVILLLGVFLMSCNKKEAPSTETTSEAAPANSMDQLPKEFLAFYQKFHRDYANADKGKQKVFASDLNHRLEEQQTDEALIWFDEFSISTRPDAAYGWAEKNTSPTVPSNEKKENGIMVS